MREPRPEYDLITSEFGPRKCRAGRPKMESGGEATRAVIAHKTS